MKKLLAVLTAIMIVFTAAAAVLAEENVFTFRNGVTFNMDMIAVMETETGRPEIDSDRTRGGVQFEELEYEKVTEDGVLADLEYLFVGNRLAAIRVKYDHGRMNYNKLMADLAEKYGEASAVDTAMLGKGIYAVDDDGFLKRDSKAFVSGNLMVVVEREPDDDGEEIEITYLDLSAEYIR